MTAMVLFCKITIICEESERKKKILERILKNTRWKHMKDMRNTAFMQKKRRFKSMTNPRKTA